MKRHLRAGAAIGGLIALLAWAPAVFAQGGSITVSIRCAPNPELIRVRNGSGAPLTVRSVESSRRINAENQPIDVPVRTPQAAVIPNDATVVYELGPGAAGNILLPTEIFDDARLVDERVVLTTDRGRFELPCGNGQNETTFNLGADANLGGLLPGLGTAVAPAQTAVVGVVVPAQQTAAAAGQAVGTASAPVANVAGTVTAPAQATAAAAAQTGSGAVATVLPPGAAQPPAFPGGLPIGSDPAQAVAPTPASPQPVRQAGTGLVNGLVFDDRSQNGLPEAGEGGLAGVTITLRGAGPDGQTGTPDDLIVATTATGADGRYNFINVAPGNYVVVETDPAGYVSTTANSVPINVTNATVVVNFGDRQAPTAGAAPAQAGGVPPAAFLGLGAAFIALSVVLSRRGARRSGAAGANGSRA